jgi:hypothetical protein
MYFLITQNQDLADVSGFAFGSVSRAIDCASKMIGVPCHAAPAIVRIPGSPSPGFHCHVAVPTETGFGGPHCREMHMILIAASEDATDIAMYLTRRNGPVYGVGQVSLTAAAVELRPIDSARRPSRGPDIPAHP